MTLTLRDGDLALTIAPERGAEARSLEFGGVELLYQAPWSPAPLPPHPIDPTPWTLAWHGGWQLLWPNAGAECTVDGVRHGFHGAGSVAPFSVIEQDAARAVLRCELDDLVCERGFELQDGRVRATARIRNAGAEASSLIVVEHLTLGGRLAAEGTRIALEGGHVIGQEWDGTPTTFAQPWPLLGDEDLSALPATTSQFAVVRDLAAGTARVTAPDRLTLDVRFDHAAFPHLWLWEERFGATVEPWNSQCECLAVEPSSVPSADGLAGAIERGEATELAPGAVFESWCELTPGLIGAAA
jgi:galactose mutarotase-like enzyme